MNRYKSGGPSTASATTRCQKCLKYGHYSFECTAAQQDRPYTYRPSRTEQLLNPKLAPKITEAKPKVEEAKPKELTSSTANSKHSRDKQDRSRKKSRSLSMSSSDSVSTISTNRSASRSRSPASRRRGSPRTRSRDIETQYRDRSHPEDRRAPRERSISRSPPRRGNRQPGNGHRHSDRSHSPNRKRTNDSTRQERSRSPFREQRRTNNYRQTRQDHNDGSNTGSDRTRKRSLSPYSKRIALTRTSHEDP